MALVGLSCKDKLDKSCDVNFLEADVNNVSWHPPEISAFNSGLGGNITIQAKANFGTMTEMSIQMFSNVKEGTYPLELGLFAQSIIAYPGAFQAETGQLTITVHDTAAHVLKGTFFFGIPSENLDVRDGSFCVTY